MRLSILSILLTLSMILVSCGGGGGGGSFSRDARISLNVDFENSRATEAGFFISNTEIDSVILEYSNDGESAEQTSSGTKDITDSAEGGTVRLTNLIIDTTYLFTVTAYGTEGELACTGSASVFVSPDAENDVDLVCEFIDELAMENAAYDFASALFSGSPISDSDIDEFVADDFGSLNGMSRAEFIEDMMSDDFDFLDDSVTLSKVDIVLASARAAGQEAFLYLYFSDGTVLSERVWMVKENGKWVLTGNGRQYESELTASAYYIIDHTGTSFYSGLNSDFYDPDGVVESISVTGPGIASAYSFLPYDCTDCSSFYIETPTQSNLAYSLYDDFINLYDSQINNISGITEDGVYTVSTTYANGTSDDYSFKVYGTPAPLSGLSESNFMRLPAATSQELSDYAGQTVTFQLTKPTGYVIKSMEYNLELSDYQGDWYEMEGHIPLSASSFTITFPSDVGFDPEEAELTLTAIDADGREFNTVIVLDTYEGSQTSSNLPGEMLSGLESFSGDETESVVAVFAQADDTNVQTTLSAISAAADAGLTAADVREAAEEAGLRKPTSSEGLAAYNALVAAFQNVSSNTSALNGLKNMLNTMTDTKLQALSSLVKAAQQIGFETTATGFKAVADGTAVIDITPADETDADLLAEDLGTILVSDILGSNAGAASVTTDLVLPEAFENGTVITWSSSNSDIIAEDGTVTRPRYNFGDYPVTLSAVAELGSAEETFSYSFIVLEEELTDASFAAEAEAFINEVFTSRTRTDFDAYVDPDMEYFAGYTRDQFVSNGQLESTSISIEDFEIYTQLSDDTIIVTFNILFSSGKKVPKYMWITKKDDDLWYFAGNGWLFGRSTTAVVDRKVDAEGTASIGTGLQFNVYDRSDQGIEMVVVEGPGLPDDGIRLVLNAYGEFTIYDSEDYLYRSDNKYFFSGEEYLQVLSLKAAVPYITYKYSAYTDYDETTMEPSGEPVDKIPHNLFVEFDDLDTVSASPEDYFASIVSSTEFDYSAISSDGGFVVEYTLPADTPLYGGGELECEDIYGGTFFFEQDLAMDGSNSITFDVTSLSETEFSAISSCEIKLVYYDSNFRKYRSLYLHDTSAGAAGVTFITMPFDVFRDTGDALYADNIEIGSVELSLTDSGGNTETMDITT